MPSASSCSLVWHSSPCGSSPSIALPAQHCTPVCTFPPQHPLCSRRDTFLSRSVLRGLPEPPSLPEAAPHTPHSPLSCDCPALGAPPKLAGLGPRVPVSGPWAPPGGHREKSSGFREHEGQEGDHSAPTGPLAEVLLPTGQQGTPRLGPGRRGSSPEPPASRGARTKPRQSSPKLRAPLPRRPSPRAAQGLGEEDPAALMGVWGTGLPSASVPGRPGVDGGRVHAKPGPSRGTIAINRIYFVQLLLTYTQPRGFPGGRWAGRLASGVAPEKCGHARTHTHTREVDSQQLCLAAPPRARGSPRRDLEVQAGRDHAVWSAQNRGWQR